jgi:two-component system, OmpR family, phosphate regulon sensor histidine kinase PhoR
MIRRRWVWVVLFILVMLLLVSLATGWNVVLVRDYRRLLEIARSVALKEAPDFPVIALALGSLGFAAAVSLIILFFVKLLNEMRLNQRQAEFLATVSHELKTPIATMELSSSLIQAGGLSEDERNRLWRSHGAELRRLREEVDALLEAARWQSNTVPLKSTAIDLERWLDESLARWRQILGPEATLRREGAPLNGLARLDLRMLNLITDNLLDNARKFARETPRVTIESRMTRGSRPWRKSRWQLRIRDEGHGFNPVDSRHIFKRFFRARVDAPYAIPGTGLGLYLASSASRAMGVTLKGESAGVGSGSVFTLEGPVLPERSR